MTDGQPARTRTDTQLIAELRRLNEARTPGEWKYGPNWVAAPDTKGPGAWGGTHLVGYCSERNAAFIAIAANHMDAILTLAESALTARAEALREAAEIAGDYREADIKHDILARVPERQTP